MHSTITKTIEVSIINHILQVISLALFFTKANMKIIEKDEIIPISVIIGMILITTIVCYSIYRSNNSEISKQQQKNYLLELKVKEKELQKQLEGK